MEQVLPKLEGNLSSTSFLWNEGTGFNDEVIDDALAAV
ncbi:hypothetical protein GGD55_005743 [Rhizobium giardinii]|uniref:Uncharacterized protein n=1 Tax=Rhizobium giardinii TaxID=56731 RepID=A0A7W8XA41_9HYPH|nr:hypothetical protein [Rhizobium giardinii]